MIGLKYLYNVISHLHSRLKKGEMAKRHQKRIMERILNYEIKQRFFESPNFSMCSDGEEVVIARVATLDAAKVMAEAYLVAIINTMIDKPIDNVLDLNDDVISVSVEDGKYIVHYEDLTAQIISIEKICPNCGCNPHDEPYCMEVTHCPECGHVFEA